MHTHTRAYISTRTCAHSPLRNDSILVIICLVLSSPPGKEIIGDSQDSHHVWKGLTAWKLSRKANPYVDREIWNERFLCLRPCSSLLPHPPSSSFRQPSLTWGWFQKSRNAQTLGREQSRHTEACLWATADPIRNWLHPEYLLPKRTSNCNQPCCQAWLAESVCNVYLLPHHYLA